MWSGSEEEAMCDIYCTYLSDIIELCAHKYAILLKMPKLDRAFKLNVRWHIYGDCNMMTGWKFYYHIFSFIVTMKCVFMKSGLEMLMENVLVTFSHLTVLWYKTAGPIMWTDPWFQWFYGCYGKPAIFCQVLKKKSSVHLLSDIHHKPLFLASSQQVT